MASPARDDDGQVIPHDDPKTIPDDADVVRYIPSRCLIDIPGTEQRRLSKNAFAGSSLRYDKYEGMSVDMRAKMSSDDVDPTSRFRPSDEAAVLLNAGFLRRIGLEVGPDPRLNDDPYHASVWGVKDSHRKRMLKNSAWLIKPDDVV